MRPVDPISSSQICDCIAANEPYNMAWDPTLRGFENLDDSAVYEKFENAVIDPATRNFVIEFNESNAYAALNFEEPFLETFLHIKVSLNFSIKISMR